MPSANSSTIPGRCRGWCAALFGFETIRDYWFPDIRSTPGAAFVLASVLYPYVYLTTRIVFLMQGRNIADVARTLGAWPSKVFWRVLLPVARPAIVAGVALVLMETINDIGAAEYLGVQDADRRGLHDLAQPRQPRRRRADRAADAGAGASCCSSPNSGARRRQRFHTARATHMKAQPPRIRARRALRRIWRRSLSALPVLCGLRHPALGVRTAMRRAGSTSSLSPELADAFLNSVLTAALDRAAHGGAGAVPAQRGAAVALARRCSAAVRLASVGYALPGGILGLGLLFVLARFDNALDAFLRAHISASRPACC